MVRAKSQEPVAPAFGDGIQIERITIGGSTEGYLQSFSREEDGLVSVQPPVKGDPTWKVFLPNDKIMMFHGMPVTIVAYRTYEETAEAEE